MMGGCTDLLLGRRGDFEKCKYWIVNDKDIDLEEFTHNTNPSGIFYAEEVSPENLRKMIINGVFMFDESLITIYTNGTITLKTGDLVLFRGDIWRVQDCQTRRVQKNLQFMKRPSMKSYIQLKK